jgi:hypothetical protein
MRVITEARNEWVDNTRQLAAERLTPDTDDDDAPEGLDDA